MRLLSLIVKYLINATYIVIKSVYLIHDWCVILKSNNIEFKWSEQSNGAFLSGLVRRWTNKQTKRKTLSSNIYYIYYIYVYIKETFHRGMIMTYPI